MQSRRRCPMLAARRTHSSHISSAQILKALFTADHRDEFSSFSRTVMANPRTRAARSCACLSATWSRRPCVLRLNSAARLAQRPVLRLGTTACGCEDSTSPTTRCIGTKHTTRARSPRAPAAATAPHSLPHQSSRSTAGCLPSSDNDASPAARSAATSHAATSQAAAALLAERREWRRSAHLFDAAVLPVCYGGSFATTHARLKQWPDGRPRSLDVRPRPCALACTRPRPRPRALALAPSPLPSHAHARTPSHSPSRPLAHTLSPSRSRPLALTLSPSPLRPRMHMRLAAASHSAHGQQLCACLYTV